MGERVAASANKKSPVAAGAELIIRNRRAKLAGDIIKKAPQRQACADPNKKPGVRTGLESVTHLFPCGGTDPLGFLKALPT